MNFRLSQHAEEQMVRRGIPDDMLQEVLHAPQQIVDDASGNRVYQSQVPFAKGNAYLLRVFVNESSDPALVVTVYRTSKIAKYWSEP